MIVRYHFKAGNMDPYSTFIIFEEAAAFSGSSKKKEPMRSHNAGFLTTAAKNPAALYAMYRPYPRKPFLKTPSKYSSVVGSL